MTRTFCGHPLSVVLAALLLTFAASVQAYSVSGEIRGWVNGAMAYDREEFLVDGPVLFDDWDSAVGVNQGAESGYVTNLSTAQVGTFMSASDLDPDSYDSAPGAYALARFDDHISFTVPEGTYPAGVYASLAGFAIGHLEAVGEVGGLYASARAQITLNFGLDSFVLTETAKGIGPTAIDINQTFTLVAQLVAPGQSVPAGGLQTNHYVSAYLQTNGVALHAYGYVNVPDSSWMIGDLYSGAGFTSLSVPVGVTWSSESGVFLSQSDSDSDGIADAIDNCLLVANSNQIDADADGLGNLCDADLNQDCYVNAADLGLLKSVFFSADPVADFDSSGSVNAIDLGLMKLAFFKAPGPAAEPNLCSP